MSKRGHQNRGKRSILDGLPSATLAELARRCRGTAPFREIRAWLIDEHGCTVALQTLSHWCMLRQEAARDAFVASRAEGAAHVRHGAFEIVVTAPGASEVSVRVYPIDAPEIAEEAAR